MKNSEIKERFIMLSNLIKEGGIHTTACLLGDGNLDEHIKKIIALEVKGDVIQDELDAHFKNEKNIPFLAIDQVKLLQRIDKTLDNASIAARVYGAFYPPVPKDFKIKLVDLANSVTQITEKVAEAIMIIYESFSKAHELSSEIERIRDESLELSFQLEREIFSLADESTGWKDFTATSTVIKKTMRIIDSVRNVAEIITIMALKYI